MSPATDDRADRPFDKGLQPERTALAWRRTALTLTVGALIALRVLPQVLGLWAIIPAGVGVLVGTATLFASHRRYSTHHRRLTSSDTDRIALPDGALPALVAVSVFLGGLACLVVSVRIGLGH